MRLNSAKDLDVYKKSYQLAMKIFKISKSFPAEDEITIFESEEILVNLKDIYM